MTAEERRELEWTPTLYDGIETAWTTEEGESYWVARWATKGLLRWQYGTGDTREEAVKVLIEMAPDVMMALHGWMDEETQKRHKLQERLDRLTDQQSGEEVFGDHPFPCPVHWSYDGHLAICSGRSKPPSECGVCGSKAREVCDEAWERHREGHAMTVFEAMTERPPTDEEVMPDAEDGSVGALEVWTCIRCGWSKLDPEIYRDVPDSNEREDDVSREGEDQTLDGRVQEWLYCHFGEDVPPDAAERLLHDTGLDRAIIPKPGTDRVDIDI